MNNDTLGRGLKSLIPDEIEEGLKTKENVVFIKTDDIEIDSHQPRKNIDNQKIAELAQSIKEHGIIQPLVVLKKKEGGYQLIAGQRRLKAAISIGLKEVPAIIRNVLPSQKLEMSLIENIQREDLNALEESESYKTLIDEFGLSIKDIAKKVGKAETTISNSVRLLNLADEVKDALSENILTAGHAKAMFSLSKQEQLKLLEDITKNKISVREMESRTKNIRESKSGANIKDAKEDLYLDDLAKKIREAFKTKVYIQKKGRGGRIIIDYYSKEELDRIILEIEKFKDYIEDDL